MVKRKISKGVSKKALDVRRPLNINRLFPNSGALIVSRKALGEMIRKGEAEEMVNLLIKLLTLLFLFQILPPITLLILILIRIA